MRDARKPPVHSTWEELDVPTLEKAVPIATIRRLPFYLQYLHQAEAIGQSYASSFSIGEALGLDAAQVRKDLALTNIVGTPKLGYPIEPLIAAIKHVLNWDVVNDAVLVGVGKLGSALLEYEGYRDYGLNIVAAFDTDLAKIGMRAGTAEVFALGKLSNLTKRMHIKLGILAVPAEHAQAVADLMVKGGIRAILNFAPVPLDVPANVMVHNEILASGLAVLCRHLKQEE